MECEICGEGEAEYIILVEGAKLHVCSDCSSAGKILIELKRKPSFAGKKVVAKEELEVVDGYGKLIADARKKMGVPLAVLAERINEKESFLDRVEHERTLPSEALARKLERELGIKLLESVLESASISVEKSGGGTTLGDIIEIEKKKKKKE